jgi:hypothetical protein
MKPLTTLLEKGKEFKWNEECQASFEELKEKIDYNSCVDHAGYTQRI